MLSYVEVVKTLILKPIPLLDDELNFKLDILFDGEKGYFAQLSRRENYKLHPSFESKSVAANESVYVIDDHSVLSLSDAYYDCIDECLTSSLHKITERFSKSS